MAKNKKCILIRYGRLHEIGLFENNNVNIPKTPTLVVIRTARGLELGQVVGQAAAADQARPKLSQEWVKVYYNNSGVNFDPKIAGEVIRIATHDDISEEYHLQKFMQEESVFCKKLIKEMNLPMKIVAVDHVFGGERIVFYFMSESRVDFRELVKKLAQEFQSRIEMRQIGSRDEAKLLGDMESCGQQCCCIRFLQELKPVNMRMAKMQKATLDPSKISGYCGRLKCCLRYEDKSYTELKKRLPNRGTIVKTAKGEGKVINTQILTQMLIVSYDDGTRGAVALEEAEILGKDKQLKSRQVKKESENNGCPKGRNGKKESENNGGQKGRNGKNQPVKNGKKNGEADSNNNKKDVGNGCESCPNCQNNGKNGKNIRKND
ncbi:MAG: hypothetical protein H8D47_01280 [Planctomycetes bacterium]|nr:hypothetical protein [Planctomycetota bacterium]MBL7107560.1 hypothetical protein [Phycisphaerae bacterium]